MAKRERTIQSRRRTKSGDDESLLLRSAESLGRVIGALQRQLDGAARGISETAADAIRTFVPGDTDESPAKPKRASGARKRRAVSTPKAKTTRFAARASKNGTARKSTISSARRSSKKTRQR